MVAGEQSMINISQTQTATFSLSSLAQGFVMVAVGATMLFVAGFANANALHGSAYDTRHAVVMPCH